MSVRIVSWGWVFLGIPAVCIALIGYGLTCDEGCTSRVTGEALWGVIELGISVIAYLLTVGALVLMRREPKLAGAVAWIAAGAWGAWLACVAGFFAFWA